MINWLLPSIEPLQDMNMHVYVHRVSEKSKSFLSELRQISTNFDNF